MAKYTMTVGIGHLYTVEVEADNEKEAYSKARQKLDDEAHAAGREPPTAWDLTFLKVEE